MFLLEEFYNTIYRLYQRAWCGLPLFSSISFKLTCWILMIYIFVHFVSITTKDTFTSFPIFIAGFQTFLLLWNLNGLAAVFFLLTCPTVLTIQLETCKQTNTFKDLKQVCALLTRQEKVCNNTGTTLWTHWSDSFDFTFRHDESKFIQL